MLSKKGVMVILIIAAVLIVASIIVAIAIQPGQAATGVNTGSSTGNVGLYVEALLPLLVKGGQK